MSLHHANDNNTKDPARISPTVYGLLFIAFVAYCTSAVLVIEYIKSAFVK